MRNAVVCVFNTHTHKMFTVYVYHVFTCKMCRVYVLNVAHIRNVKSICATSYGVAMVRRID